MVKNKQKDKKRAITGISVINFHAAGADISSTRHDIAIYDNGGGQSVKTFATFTINLEDAVQWLKEKGITTLAMESTGVYYLPFYIMLQEAGIEPYLVNARHVKNVTGRKKDETDAMWIQRLHSCGLLQNCFQPDNDYRTLRTYVRQRKDLINRSSDESRRMQKALELMNIKVQNVISDILGKTGMKIIEAILEGNMNPAELSKLRDPRIKASEEEIFKSLQGIWKEEYLFLLRQAYDGYWFYHQQAKECENQINDQLIRQIAKSNNGDITIGDTKVRRKPKKNQFDNPIAPALKTLVGVDLTGIPGISELSALEFIAETGTDINKWKSQKCFAGWLNVVPNTKITGGKIISSRMMKKKNRAGQTLRMSASTLTFNKTPLGDYYRRMSSRYGGKGAVLATANKLSRIIYKMLQKKEEFNFNMLEESQKKFRESRIKKLEKQLERLKKAA